MARPVQLVSVEVWIKCEQLLDEHSEGDLASFTVDGLLENLDDVLAHLCLDVVEDVLQVFDGVFDMLGDLVVLESELYLLQDREGDRVDEDHSAVYTAGVHHQNLLVALLQREEFGLGPVHGIFVVQADEVFAAIIGADRDALLREARTLLDVPDFEDPVGVEGVYAAAALVTHHVDDVVVLEWRPGAQVDGLQRLGGSDVILIQ